MAQKRSAKSASSSDHVSSARLHSKALPVVTPIQTDMSRMSPSELVSFQNNLDCSKVVDVFTGAPTVCYYCLYMHTCINLPFYSNVHQNLPPMMHRFLHVTALFFWPRKRILNHQHVSMSSLRMNT